MRLHATRLPETTVSDRIVLTLPTASSFRSVATLVLGGLGSRMELPYERMDDLQLAVLSALDSARGPSATLEADVDDERIRLAVGPLELGDGDRNGMDLVLSRLVDEVAYEEREGAAWVVLSLERSAAP
jgi:anti-sigma regulatory factor (Ser/Thr protein kinase)